MKVKMDKEGERKSGVRKLLFIISLLAPGFLCSEVGELEHLPGRESDFTETSWRERALYI